MAEITISKETYDRLVEFEAVSKALMEEDIDFDTYAESILIAGLNSLLTLLLEQLDHSTLIRSFQQLADKYPRQLYRYMVEILQRGESVQVEEQFRQRMGLTPPMDETIVQRG